MAKSGNTGNVFDIGELRRLVDELGAGPREVRAAVLEGAVADNEDCDCPSCGADALTFPPVELAPDGELAASVLKVPLVLDAQRLAAWTGTREVSPESLLPDPFLPCAELGLPNPARLHLLWVVAVNTGMLRISGAWRRRVPWCSLPSCPRGRCWDSGTAWSWTSWTARTRA